MKNKVKVGKVTMDKSTKETLESIMGKTKFERFVNVYQSTVEETRKETKRGIKDDKEI